MSVARLLFALTLLVRLYSLHAQSGAKFFNTPMHEIMQSELYVKYNELQEYVVVHAGRGADLRPGDYLTNADGVRILSGGLDLFLKSGEKEVLVPVVDDEDNKFDGYRLTGFVMLQNVLPRKLATRRGEIAFDLEEGGPAPSLKLGNIVIGQGGAKTTSDPSYQPPPHGGGACITSRDCYYNNGTCIAGACSCLGTYTGTYCQLNRPEYAAISMLVKKTQKSNPPPLSNQDSNTNTKAQDFVKLSVDGVNNNNNNNNNNIQDSDKATVTPSGAIKLNLSRKQSTTNNNPPPAPEIVKEPIAEDNTNQIRDIAADSNNDNSSQDSDNSNNNENQSGNTPKKKKRKPKARPNDNINNNEETAQNQQQEQEAQQQQLELEQQQQQEQQRQQQQQQARQASQQSQQSSSSSGQWKRGDAPAEPKVQQQQQQPQQNDNMNEEQFMKAATVEDLYGVGKAYPEPYSAGKLPNQMVHERFRKRFNRERFIYSVRFRSGPIGLTFDNKVPDATIVESVVKGQQADLSDIKVGDQLIALDQYNTSTAPAKATQRIMGNLAWPRILTFESKVSGVDPREEEEKLKKRTYNVTILSPPTLAGEFQIRIAEWAKLLDLTTPTHETLQGQTLSNSQFCPVFRLRSGDDMFGCRSTKKEYTLSDNIHEIIRNVGHVDANLDEESTMFAALLQEIPSRNIKIEPRSLGIVKRGVCTFVEKTRSLQNSGASFVMVTNTENELVDMPNGKEKIGDINIPIAMSKINDTALIQLAATKNDIWAVITESTGSWPACAKVITIAEDIVDKWPHSIPYMSSHAILTSKPPDNTKLRGLTEEGGRIAVSGENGWAFFDYHLAMFGPQEVPLGPYRLQMAMPPFGCDPNGYSVRIRDTVVAILRGGGCSFGIKVINAQKLGAKAVMIVNTDDMKTMRLMALPDEVPLIQIPCIMVSRRIQFYLEEQLRPFYTTNQHMVSIQPTGTFGEYEKRNQVTLPMRLSNS